MTSHPYIDKLEAILATLDEVTRLSEISDAMRRIARGFVDIGAIMCVIMADDGKVLRVAARWPEAAADELFARLRGGSFPEFTIPLANVSNNYVRVFHTMEALVLDGPDAVADHIASTYELLPEQKGAVRKALTGALGAVLPMIADGRAVGVVGINYREDLSEPDRHLFNIFSRSAATLLSFKRDVVSREAILADLERALANERKTREELNRAERLAALGEMAAVVAHEIRNPVAIIKNSAASLKKVISDDPEERLLCDIIDEETASIDRIIDDMLAFSQPLERGGHHLPVRELIERAVSLLGKRAHRSAIRLSIACGAGLDEVVVDAHRVTHALVNLLINARQATEEQGDVSVTAQRIGIDGRDYIRIEVRDTGIGIPEDIIDDVFTPFVTTKHTGTGLGLSIVKRIVDAHGGRVAVRSRPGQGTTVSIDLPAFEPEDP